MARNEAVFILKDKMEKSKGVLVLLEMDNHTTAFGLSLLSDKDKWKYKTGLELAMNRATNSIKIEREQSDYWGFLDQTISDIRDEDYIIREEAVKAIFGLCWKHYRMLYKLFDLALVPSKACCINYGFVELINKITKGVK